MLACLQLLLSALDSGAGVQPMEEYLEADVLWPETPPPSRARGSYPPELHEAFAAAADFSCESFGSDMSWPASSSSSSAASSSAPAFGRRSSDGFLSDPSAFAGGGGHGGDDASFQEADVLWPDDGYATRERDVDGGELWWRLCWGIGEPAAADRGAEPAAGCKRGPWRAPLVSSPIDIPTGVAAVTAYRRRRPTIGMGGLSQAHW